MNYPLATGKDVGAYADAIDWKGKIIWMSPQKFLSLVRPLKAEWVNHDSMKNIEQRLTNNLPIDPLVLEVDMSSRKIIGHEGRHRAIKCIELGIKSVPVLVVTGSMYPRTPKWTPEQHKDVEDVINFIPENSLPSFKEYFSLLLEDPDNFDGAAFFEKDARAFIVGKGFYAITSTHFRHGDIMKEMRKILYQYGKVIKEPLVYDGMAFYGDFSSIYDLFTKGGKPNTNRSTILQLSKTKGLGVLVGRLWLNRSRISLWNNIKDVREDTVDYLLDVAHDYYGKDLSRYTWEAFRSEENSFHEKPLVYPVFDEFLDDIHEQSTKKPKGREKDEITNPQWDKLHVMPPEKKGQAMKKLGYKPKQGVDIKDRYMKANDDERRRMGL